MFCTVCGTSLPEGTLFCPRCGTAVGPTGTGTPLPGSVAAVDVALTRATHLVMLWDKLAMMRNYRFEDPAGTPLGETRGEIAFPVKYTLFDTQGQPVLVLDGGREHGLQFAFYVRDASGTVLATLRMRSSFLSRRYGISVGATESMFLTTDASGYHYRVLEAGSESVLATGDRSMAVRTARTEIAIADAPGLDHRIMLGAMILAEYLSTR